MILLTIPASEITVLECNAYLRIKVPLRRETIPLYPWLSILNLGLANNYNFKPLIQVY